MVAVNYSCVTVSCEQVFVILQWQKNEKYNDGFQTTHEIIRKIISGEELDGGL